MFVIVFYHSLQMNKLFRQSQLLRSMCRNVCSSNARPMSAQTSETSSSSSSSSSVPVSRDMFLAQFTQLSNDLSHDQDTPDLHPLLSAHLSDLLHYTVLGGKMNRGLSVPHTYSLLAPHSSQRELDLASLLGWTVELLQAFFLVADDIMDGSVTRRGQPCWYHRTGGVTAFNDSLILETCVYSIIRHHFRSEPCYLPLLENMLEVTKFTTYGQSLDTISANNFTQVRGQEGSLDAFTMDRYTAIVKYKTSFYSFYLPVVLAMNMAGFTDQKLYDNAREILLEIGHYFQVTDDYLDCYGDPAVIGKIGTDIQDGKCSWLIVKALESATDEDKKILAQYYGSHSEEHISIIKNIYNKLNIEKQFRDYEQRFHEDVIMKINNIDSGFPKEVFIEFLNKVYKRKV